KRGGKSEGVLDAQQAWTIGFGFESAGQTELRDTIEVFVGPDFVGELADSRFAAQFEFYGPPAVLGAAEAEGVTRLVDDVKAREVDVAVERGFEVGDGEDGVADADDVRCHLSLRS